MTLDEAIKHCKDVSGELRANATHYTVHDPKSLECLECAEDHEQLAEWLKELKRDRRILANMYNELSEIRVNCESIKKTVGGGVNDD